MKLDLCIIETSKHTNKHTNKFQNDWRPKCKKNETLQVLEENTGRFFLNLGVKEGFLTVIQNSERIEDSNG